MKIWSKYNTLFTRESVYLFYNSLSNAFVELSKYYYDQLRQYKPGEAVEIADKELEAQLIRMKALVDDDEYEIRKIRFTATARRYGNESLSLTINPTLACNFRCPYCFEEGHPVTRMTDEIEEKVVNFIRSFNAKRLSVTWFGGEPLLEFNRIKSLTAKFTTLGLSYQASIITNGYLLTKEIAQQFAGLKIHKAQITLDGVGADHDCRRFLQGGRPTFDTIYRNLLDIGEHVPELKVTIRVNIDKDNINSFIDVYNLIGNKYHNIRVVPAFVSDVDGDGHLPCVMNVDEKFAYLRKLFHEHKLEFNKFYPDYIRQECSVRNAMSIVIGPEGELYKCWNDVAKPDKVYGHIGSGITNEKVLYDYLTKADPFDDERCRACLLLPVCGGGCPYARMIDLEKKTNKACPLNVTNLADYLWEHYLCKTQKTKKKTNKP